MMVSILFVGNLLKKSFELYLWYFGLSYFVLLKIFIINCCLKINCKWMRCKYRYNVISELIFECCIIDFVRNSVKMIIWEIKSGNFFVIFLWYL